MTNKEISLVISTINKTISYMKSPIDDLINKKLFINLRNTFPLQYNYACRFYNANTTKDMINISCNILNRLSKKLLESNTITDKEKLLLNNQYKSLYKTVDDAFKNIDNNTLENIITHISDVDKSTITIRMIVKGLILLQIAYNTKDVIYNTIENNNQFEYISEHNLLYLEQIQEHMYEYQYSTDFLSNSSENADNDNNRFINTIDEEVFIENINKKINDKLVLLESDDVDEIEFTEADLFEDDYGYDQSEDNEISYSTDNIDEYIQKIYYKIIFLFKESIDKIIDVDYKLLPNMDIIMYYVISILMLYIQRFN